MKLTLIRHGLTEGNVKRLYYGSTDIPLLPESIEKLREAGSKGGYPTASLYFTSGMLRTEQTFNALYGELDHGILAGMREIDFGDFEMRSYEELMHDEAYIKWISGDAEKDRVPNGESGVIVTERALNSLYDIINGNEDAVCITHGGVIGGLMSLWFPTENGRYAYTPEPGCGYSIEFEKGAPVSYEIVPDLNK